MVSRKMLKAQKAAEGQAIENAQLNEEGPSDSNKDSTLDKLPKILASTKKGTRHKGMQALSLWLTSRTPSEDDLKKVWKGLFYAVWHADKAPVQEELVTRVARLMLGLKPDAARSFLQVFLWTMRREWSGIDRLRLDKFYLLLRTFLRTTLEYLQKAKWEATLVTSFMQVYSERTLEVKDNHAALGINLHLADTFLEEVNHFAVNSATAFLLLEPFLRILAHSQDKVLLPRIESTVFGALIDDRKQVDDASSFSQALDFDQLASRLFALASAPETAPKNRAVLYAVHAQLKREGAHQSEQSGGEAEVSEEPPVKENGKRGALAVVKEKKKRKVEGKGKLDKTDAAEQNENVKEASHGNGLSKKSKKASLETVSDGEVENHKVAGTSNGTDDKLRKRKKAGEEEHAKVSVAPETIEEPAPGGDVTKEKKARKGAGEVEVSEGLSNGEEIVSKKSAKAGKRKADEASLEVERTESDNSVKLQREGTKKVQKSTRAAPEGGSKEQVEAPPAAAKSETPERKKLLKAALKRATAEAKGNGSGEAKIAKRKARKRADVAADVADAGLQEADVQKSDAIAAIESALNDLRNADSPVVAQKKRKGKAKKGTARVEEILPSTPVGEVEFESPVATSENDSAAKRRKSGAGATPAVAPKSDAASEPDTARSEAGAADLAGRLSEAEVGLNGRRKRRKAESGHVEVVATREVVASQTEGGSSLVGALVLAPQELREQSSALKKKKVRFSLKSNLEFKYGSPLPEKMTRTPLAATPRGSALKVKGPSPIRRQGASLVDGFPLGSRRNKKRQGPILIHLAGVRGQAGRVVRGWSPGKGAGRGQARRGRRRMQVR